jgi:hypothetical protein
VAPAAGVAQARSLGLSKALFLLKSIHPQRVALAVTPDSEIGAVNVVPAAPILTGPENAVVPSSAVIAVPNATESGLLVGFKVLV